MTTSAKTSRNQLLFNMFGRKPPKTLGFLSFGADNPKETILFNLLGRKPRTRNNVFHACGRKPSKTKVVQRCWMETFKKIVDQCF